MLREVGRQGPALVDATREIAAVREALSGLETQAVVGAVQVLTDVAESLARTTETMRAMQSAEWMTHEQAAAYLQRTPGAFKELVRTDRGAEHYLSERGILYSRTELDAWLMSR
ncbi:MAG: hypothetical protein ACR2KW_04690 [Rubrobacter sp.]